jgi:hypothetical protein
MSADLEVIVRSPALTRERAALIVADVRRLDRYIPIDTRGRRSPTLDVWAHDILSEEADWDAPEWDFDPAGLDRLENTLGRISDLLPEEFTLEACWGGDKPQTEVVMTRDELLGARERKQAGQPGAVPRVATE